MSAPPCGKTSTAQTDKTPTRHPVNASRFTRKPFGNSPRKKRGTLQQGLHLDGPEGSSIRMAVYCLRLVDEDFARDQYQRARKELGRELLVFAWSREWPVSWQGPMDIDSGAVIPLLEISAGGSGLAFVGASSFGDVKFLSKLHTTLDFAAFPRRSGGRLKYCASNQVGDAVMLYSCVLGPLWEKVKGGRK